METISFIGIIVGLAFLVILAMRGWHILLLAPLASLIVMLFSGMSITETFYGEYMTGFANFAIKMFFIFLTGAIFAKLMEDSGAAKSIANTILKITSRERPILVCTAIFLMTVLLTYGGVTVWVVIFAIVPIARPLFREANISWHLFPGVFTLGCWTIAMTMIPGTPQVQNLLPMQYLGTSPTSAPVLGLIGVAVTLLCGYLYYSWQLRKFAAKGKFYAGSDPLGEKMAQEVTEEKPLPSFWFAILPSVVLLVLLNAFKLDPLYAFAGGIVTAVVVFWKFLENPVKTLTQGAVNSAVPMMNTATDVGFASVVAKATGFALAKAMLAKLGHPLISAVVATTCLAAFAGSASGGLGVALELFSEEWLASGLNVDVIHRLACMACGGLDTLPHNGAVVTVIAVVGLTHKEAYQHMGVSTVLIPLIATAVCLVLAILGFAY